MAKILRPENREAWLELRKQGIGSSEVATIMGVNPFDTPLRLWRRKKGLDPAIPENNAMLMGHLLEDAVAQRWMLETKQTIIKNSAVDFIMVDEEHDYMRVSPDRLYWLEGMPHNMENRGIVECKTTALDVDYDRPPLHWFIQLQYQLGVSGFSEGWLAWLTRGRDFGCRRFEFDKDYFKEQITEAVTRFVVDNLEGNQEPPAYNTDDVLLKSPRSIVGKSVVANADLIATVHELKAKKEQAKAFDKEVKELEDTIKMAIDDAEFLVDSNGQTIATWKNNKDSQKFDQKAFEEAHPDVYGQFLKTTPGARVLRLK